MACVELPAFPLQWLLKRHPEWVSRPVVVVDRDKPQGVILWANDQARAHRIRSGMRYSAGLSLARTLHAGEVPAADIKNGVAFVVDLLRRFSPDVEPCADEPGVFWLNASGLSHLYASLRSWATEIRLALEVSGFHTSIAVGFTRFGTYAIAKAVNHDITIARNRSEEQVLTEQVPLERLRIEPGLRDTLNKLGVRTVRAFLQLPVAGIRRRFGLDAHRLHQLAADDLWMPLQPLRVNDPLVQRHDLEDPETDVSRLVFLIKQLLHRLLITLTARQEALTGLTLRFRLNRAGVRTEWIRPAAPTVDVRQIMNLVGVIDQVGGENVLDGDIAVLAVGVDLFRGDHDRCNSSRSLLVTLYLVAAELLTG